MSTIRVDNFGPSAGGTTYSARGIAKAWVNFNGTGTIAARDSENVSSLTDNGTADYTVNWSNAFATANYAATYGAQYSSTSIVGLVCETTGTTRTTAALQVRSSNSAAAAAIDLPAVQVAIHGDLA